MDLKFLDENDSRPQTVRGGKLHFFVILALAVLALAAGIAFLNHRSKESRATAAQGAVSAFSVDSVIASKAPSSGAVSSVQTAFRQSGDWRLILVNGKVRMPDDDRPQIVDYGGIQMDKRIEPAFLAMKAAAAKDGISLWLSGGYRSADTQKKLFQQEVQKNLQKGMAQDAAEKAAQKIVSRPGFSEHNTGLSLDFNGSSSNFASSEAFAWLQKHAAEYGFILRYPKEKESVTGVAFEPWFYRYVGKENARKISAGGLCLEEYLKAP